MNASVRLRAYVGAGAAFASFAALGALEAAFGEALPGLHALPESAGAARWIGVALTAASLVALTPWRPAAAPLILVWGAVFLAALWQAVTRNGDLLDWVPVAETLVFTAVAVWRFDPRGAVPLRFLFGVMLILFGAIHLTQRETIASLIPDWIAFPAYWPWITGAIQCLAGFACIVDRAVRPSCGLVAAMYLSWLPLLHLPRLVEAATSLFEWTFALTALALAGVALIVAAGYAPVATGVSSRAPHSAHEPS